MGKRDQNTLQNYAPGSGEKGRPCRELYRQQELCPSREECTPQVPSDCGRPVNIECPDSTKPPSPPPLPKIHYTKCSTPTGLSELPKYPMIFATPQPPPLPKMPKLPNPSCSSAAPPPPNCPRAARCPERPPPKECPPPPPSCEPYPCPLPCPPPCCPPPPPCPPCPTPVPCPKPCPPPSVPRFCPCPEPPPACPHPGPRSPCTQLLKVPEGVSSYPGCLGWSTGNGKMSTYLAISRFHPGKSVQARRLHLCATRAKKSGDSGCKKIEEICQSEKGSCIKTCDKKSECNKKRHACSEVKKTDTKSWGRKKKKKKKKVPDCRQSCLPIGKCVNPPADKPEKMVYGPAKCPPPKFVSPQPCPDPPDTDLGPCVEVRSYIKPKKEVCVPPPLPKPPTQPVVLCPCPPPPKMHPGPCPCFELRKEQPEQYVKPCNRKEKYVCPREPHVCPQDGLLCKRDKGCDPEKMEKRKKRKDPPQS